MNIVGVMMESDHLSFCGFYIGDELYKFSYNRKADYGYIDRMEENFIIKLDSENAKGVYQYLKRQQ